MAAQSPHGQDCRKQPPAPKQQTVSLPVEVEIDPYDSSFETCNPLRKTLLEQSCWGTPSCWLWELVENQSSVLNQTAQTTARPGCCSILRRASPAASARLQSTSWLCACSGSQQIQCGNHTTLGANSLFPDWDLTNGSWLQGERLSLSIFPAPTSPKAGSKLNRLSGTQHSVRNNPVLCLT